MQYGQWNDRYGNTYVSISRSFSPDILRWFTVRIQIHLNPSYIRFLLESEGDLNWNSMVIIRSLSYKSVFMSESRFCVSVCTETDWLKADKLRAQILKFSYEVITSRRTFSSFSQLSVVPISKVQEKGCWNCLSSMILGSGWFKQLRSARLSQRTLKMTPVM